MARKRSLESGNGSWRLGQQFDELFLGLARKTNYLDVRHRFLCRFVGRSDNKIADRSALDFRGAPNNGERFGSDSRFQTLRSVVVLLLHRRSFTTYVKSPYKSRQMRPEGIRSYGCLLYRLRCPVTAGSGGAGSVARLQPGLAAGAVAGAGSAFEPVSSVAEESMVPGMFTRGPSG